MYDEAAEQRRPHKGNTVLEMQQNVLPRGILEPTFSGNITHRLVTF